MYLFHQRHYSYLTFPVSYERKILKDVTNRTDINEDLVHSNSVKLSSKNVMFVVVIGIILSVYLWAGRSKISAELKSSRLSHKGQSES